MAGTCGKLKTMRNRLNTWCGCTAMLGLGCRGGMQCAKVLGHRLPDYQRPVGAATGLGDLQLRWLSRTASHDSTGGLQRVPLFFDSQRPRRHLAGPFYRGFVVRLPTPCSELWPLCHSHKLVNLNFSRGHGEVFGSAHNWSEVPQVQRPCLWCSSWQLGHIVKGKAAERVQGASEAEVVVAWEWEPQS